MELRQLKYFVKVAETFNFSEAAKAIHVSQSALSQQIRQLEEELGEPLFVRSSHNVDLTEAGRTILSNAKQALYEASICKERINDINRLATGTLNIGVTYSFSPILTETLLTFVKAYPNIKLNIFYKPMNELLDLLCDRVVDFALAFKPTRNVEEIESHILFQNCLSVVVGENHPLAERDCITLRELEKYDMALPSKGLQARNAFDDRLPSTCNLRVKIELNEVNILLKLIRQSKLVTVLAEATAHDAAGIKVIKLQDMDSEMAGCVHVLKGTYRKKSMTEFIRMLGESIAVRERRDAWL